MVPFQGVNQQVEDKSN
jgi:hypothetical protein